MRPPLVLLLLALCALAWAAIVIVTGGGVIDIGGLRLSSRAAWRPLLLAAMLLATYALAGGRGSWRQDARRVIAVVSARRIAVLAVAIALLLGVRFGTFTASTSDPYGYVSQADLWLDRTLIIDAPLGADAPWPAADWSLTPLGYRPGSRRGTMVPTYSAGLPIVMALFKAVAGERAVYFVVPVLGGLSVWLTWLLARQLAGDAAGAMAAVGLLSSPAFLFMLMWPMSDVPAMAWWLASAVLAMRTRGWWSLVASGLAAAMAIVTRPNLVLLAPAVALLATFDSVDRRKAVARLGVWGVAALPGPVVTAIINNHLFGSPLQSGYGGFRDIYTVGSLGPNLVRYPMWILQTQTPFILIGLIAPFVLRREADGARRARLAAWCIGFALLVMLAYLFYTPFEEWWYLRFVLPAFPMLLAAAAAAAVTMLDRMKHGRLVLVAGTVALMVFGMGVARARSVFDLRQGEARYERTAKYVSSTLPADAVILCTLHSGSLRYYAHRLTIRFEWLSPAWFTRAQDWLEERGYPVYAVLEAQERDEFRERFGKHQGLAWLDREPLEIVDGRVYVYELPSTRPARPPAIRPGAGGRE